MPGSPYRSLTTAIRQTVVGLDLASSRDARDLAIRRLVVRGGGFRPGTLRSWTAERLAREIVRHNLEDPLDEEWLLSLLYLEVEPDLQIAFLEATGVPHDGAYIADDAPMPRASPEVIRKAAREIIRRFDDRGRHYLMTTAHYNGRDWPGLAEALAEDDVLREPVDAVLEITTQEAAGPVRGEGPSRLAPPGALRLGVLDDVCILAVINSAVGADGAPRREEVRRLVAELVRANAQRLQSWYAAGLYRALHGDDGIAPLSSDAMGARRWYAAGRVTGLARLQQRDALLDRYDSDAVTRALGDGLDGASDQAAKQVFAALWEAERFDDAVTFVHPRAIARQPSLGDVILRSATALLSAREWQRARPAFDLLRAGLADREASGTTVDAALMRTIERRQAHCRRLAGEFDAAHEILQTLIEDEAEAPALRAMMLADRALMDAGFRDLAEVQLPSDRNEAHRLATRLDHVHELLVRAVELDPDGAAHARYLLGVRALLHERGTEAHDELERALSAFRARPATYTRHNLLAQAEVHAALATCFDLAQPAPRVQAAVERLLASPADAIRIPDWMLDSVLTAIGAGAPALADRFAVRLLAGRSDEVLPRLAALADVLLPIAQAFLHRAQRTDLSTATRVRAARTALTGLLRHQQLDAADEALGLVLEAGMQGIARDEAIQLLVREEAELSRLRDPDELRHLRAELLLAAGDRGGAIGLWTSIAHEMLARSEIWERAGAFEIIDRLAELREADLTTADLREQLRRVESNLSRPTPPRALLPVRLLVVGGNEVQVQYEDEIQAILRRDAAHISVEFISTGWSSNWGAIADEVERKLGDVDGMVLHYLVRTMFGRRVRKAAHVWCAVAGHGRDGILRGIYRCAELAQRRTSD